MGNTTIFTHDMLILTEIYSDSKNITSNNTWELVLLVTPEQDQTRFSTPHQDTEHTKFTFITVL